MNKNLKNKIISLLRSGDFTIAYHDSGYCSIYEGKYEYDDLQDDKELCYLDDSDGEGYLPLIVEYLTEALGGKAVTI